MKRTTKPAIFASLRIQTGMIQSLVTGLFLLSFASAMAAAQTLTTLYTFTGGADGKAPVSGLVRDPQGNLYGTTGGGGTQSSDCGAGCGVVFEVTAADEYKVLYSFTGGADGSTPGGSLVRDAQGNLYGTAIAGGVSCGRFATCGVIFELTPTGTEKVLYSFTGGTDGGAPQGSLFRDAKGNLYGTTSCGGFSACDAAGGFGVIFELSAGGKFKVLYRFIGGADGGNPTTGLVRDLNGNLYGTANDGSRPCTCGVVFELSAAGSYKVLHHFSDKTDGGFTPATSSGLIVDAKGNLYGTTFFGGGTICCDRGFGVVFKVNPVGQEKVLYRFSGSGYDGSNPRASLIMDANGNLYGTTVYGGFSNTSNCQGFTPGCGAVFELTPNGVGKALYNFTGGADGGFPTAGLVRAPNGNLYGTTYSTVFKVTP